MMTANPNVECFILMDDGAIEARPSATDFSRRFGPNPRKGEPDQFTEFLSELEIEGWGSNFTLTPVLRTKIKHNNVNPKEYLFQPSIGDAELEAENILFIPYVLTEAENFRLSFPKDIGKKTSQEASFVLAITIRNLKDVEESDFKTAFNTFGRDATRFCFTDKLDYTTDNMQREGALAYRVNIKGDHTIALPDLKKGIQGLIKVYQLLCEKLISDKEAAQREAETKQAAEQNKEQQN